MDFLVNFISFIFERVRALFGLISPIFSEASDFKGWPLWLRIFTTIVFLGAICFGLYWLGVLFEIKKLVGSAPNSTIQNFYLPILFLLLVLFSWLAYGLWSVLTTDTDAIEFPDIQENFDEAKKRLLASGLSFLDAPVFLMLGMPAERLDPLFLASGVNGIIRTPGQGQPAIRIYAWEKAIFVVCPGASSWGQFCIAVTDQSGGQNFAAQAGSNAPDPGKTIAPGQAFGGMDEQNKAEMEALLREASRRELSYDEQERLRELAEMAQQGTAAARKVSISDSERNLQTRRLKFLCRLIRQERRPWCGINGVVVLIPWTSLESDDLVRLGTGILNQELVAAREVFRQRYPTYSLVVDLESAEGFDEFASGFHQEMRKRRIGQGLPLLPTLKGDEVRQVPTFAANWIGTNVLPSWILRFLKFEAGSEARQSLGEDVRFNRSLYLLLRSVYERGPRLAEILSRGVPPIGGIDEFSDALMLGGCYLAATGSSNSQQAFVEGVFQRIIESQEFVSWTPAAMEDDARLNRYANIGYILALLGLAVAIGVSFYLYKSTGK